MIKQIKSTVFRITQCVLTCLYISIPVASANPTGATVVNGQVTFTNPATGILDINNSPGAIINWQGFSIGTSEITRFIQENGSSAVLNRIIGADPSKILGQLHSNGQVFLINPNGIIFGPDSVIDVNSLIASTLNMTNQDFLDRIFRFEGNGQSGSIEAGGTIHSQGNVMLIAPDIHNSGIIKIENGNIILAAGEKVLMLEPGVNEIVFEVQAPDNQVLNVGKLIARKGAVGLFASQLKHEGHIEANRVTRDADGTIRLVASGNVDISGSLSARGENGNSGGFIEILGQDIQLRGATINTDGDSGGDISVDNGNNGLINDSRTAGSSNLGAGSVGGNITVEGEYIALVDDTSIDASGDSGGGTILIGGDYRGGNPDINNAQGTYVGTDVTIKSDAVSHGDGGKVIVWADDVTKYYGDISARGGSQSGDGGFVETSGKEYLEAFGTVDASASNGAAGTWLLDPRNVSIKDMISVGGSFSGEDPNVFTPTLDSAVVNRNTIETSLNGGTSVTIETGATGSTQDGDITVVDSISKKTGGAATLTLTAHDDIFINADILDETSSNTLSLTLNANDGNASDSVHGVVIDTAGAEDDIYLTGLDVMSVSGAGLTVISSSGRPNDEIRISAQRIVVDVTGGVEITNQSSSNGTIVKSLGNTDGTKPYDLEIDSQYLIVDAAVAFSVLTTEGGSMRINTTGVIDTVGPNRDVSVLVKSTSTGDYAAIDSSRNQADPDNPGEFLLLDTGMQIINVSDGGIKVMDRGDVDSTSLITGGVQTIDAAFVQVDTSGGFAGIQSQGIRSQGSARLQTLNISGRNPVTQNAIDVIGTNGGYAQIGFSTVRQVISITGPKADIRLSSDGTGSGAQIIGEQQIHGANPNDPAGNIVLKSINDGWTSIRGKNAGGPNPGQTIYANSLFLEASDTGSGTESGGAQVDVDVSFDGDPYDSPVQNITLDGLVDGKNFGLLIESTSAGFARVIARNRSSKFDGRDGINQNLDRIGLEQNITVNKGIRVISSDANSYSAIEGGQQVIQAQFFEVIATKSESVIDNRDNLDMTFPPSVDVIRGGKTQTLTATGVNGDGLAILVQANSINGYARVTSFVPNFPGEPPVGSGGPNDNDGTIGAGQTITTASIGGIRVENTGGAELAELYGSDQTISAEYIEVVADDGTAAIYNESNQSDPSTQTITTSGNNGGVGILVETTGDGTAEISSFDRTGVFDVTRPNIDIFVGLPQVITANNGTIKVITSTDIGETGKAYLYGGPISVNAANINVVSGAGLDAVSSITADSGDLLLAAVGTVTLQGGMGVDAHASVSSTVGGVTIKGSALVFNGVVGGGQFEVKAQTEGGGSGMVTLTAGQTGNGGNININGPGTVSDPATIVVASGNCSVDGDACDNNPVFSAPNVEFVDLNSISGVINGVINEQFSLVNSENVVDPLNNTDHAVDEEAIAVSEGQDDGEDTEEEDDGSGDLDSNAADVDGSEDSDDQEFGQCIP